MEIITFVLATIGTLGTIFSTIRVFTASRTNMQFRIVDYVRINDVTQFFIEMQNLSSAPICISSVSIIDGASRCKCELLSKKILLQGDILYRTPLFPINLPPRTSRLFFLEFLCAPKIFLVEGKTVLLSFDTNRGTLEKELVLPDTAHYLHKK